MSGSTAEAGGPRRTLNMGVAVAVLGIVYGDLGTSPLYAFQAALGMFNGTVARVEVLGVLSLIFWTLIIIVSVKYVGLVMRADNRGEGGVLALMALAQRVCVTPRMRAFVAVVGIAGASLFFGDGVITPAISVLSALEGLEVSSPDLKQYVLPISAVVIVLLFALQYRGTHRMGRLFGPVMVIWFLTLALLGIYQVIGNPGVLAALSPTYAYQLVVVYKSEAFIVLGAVVLCTTGAEALYADMGHFGARPIRLSWTFFVLPSVVLNYFGQGAVVLYATGAASNPFFRAAPQWANLPLVVLATLATVIASQSVISGAYSLSRQCLQLGFLPRMTVRHTSMTELGQIYVPTVNRLLLIGVLALVFAFGSSERLASAYGIAVTGTFSCTTILAAIVFRRQFHWPRIAVLGVFGFLFLIDITFFASNTLKVIDGGWVPLILGLGLLGMMMTWKRGRDLMFARWRQDSLPLASFLARLPQSRTIRVPGLAIFMTANPDFVPNALLHNLKHNKVLHERVLFVTVHNIDVPEVRTRMEVAELAPGIHRVTLRYGFMESPNIPRALETLPERGVAFDPMQASYFLGREIMVPGSVPKMTLWRRWLFTLMARNAQPATEFFGIPPDRVVELGARVAI